jgi:hypothetical protein
MARKTRKQKQRAAARRQPPSIPGGAGLGQAAAGPVALDEPTLDQEQEQAPAAEDSPAGAQLPVLSEPAAPGAAAPRPVAPLTGAGGRRRIERLRSPAPAPAGRARVPSNAASMFAPLESDDAAIPFDRVPYVRADLRRVAVIAGLMVVVIVIAAIVVSHIVS